MTKVSSRDVLKVIAAGGIAISAAVVPPLPMIILEAYKTWKDINRSEFGQIVKRLQRQELIAIRENSRKVTVEITDKGKRRLLEYDFENIERKARKRDSRWRLIIFDIPENKKRNRDAFRKKLIQIGCIRLQDSVFASAFPCKDEIDFLANFLDVSDYVTLVSLDKIERGEELIFKRYIDNFDTL